MTERGRTFEMPPELLLGFPMSLECPVCEAGPCRYTPIEYDMDENRMKVVVECIECAVRCVPRERRTMELRGRQEGP